MESSFNFLGFNNALNREGQSDSLYNHTFNRSKSKNYITFYDCRVLSNAINGRKDSNRKNVY